MSVIALITSAAIMVMIGAIIARRLRRASRLLDASIVADIELLGTQQLVDEMKSRFDGLCVIAMRRKPGTAETMDIRSEVKFPMIDGYDPVSNMSAALRQMADAVEARQYGYHEWK